MRGIVHQRISEFAKKEALPSLTRSGCAYLMQKLKRVALQRLVHTLEAGRIPMGIVVIHEESCASRHLKHCALELNIPMTVSIHWIIRSIYTGQLISLEEKNDSRPRPEWEQICCAQRNLQYAVRADYFACACQQKIDGYNGTSFYNFTALYIIP
ncbi:hypothetical protein OROGR_028007 [Orobanche gracilis]